MSIEDEDKKLRAFLNATAIKMTPEMLKKAEEEAPWIKLTGEGLEMSRGMVELLKSIMKDGE